MRNKLNLLPCILLVYSLPLLFVSCNNNTRSNFAPSLVAKSTNLDTAMSLQKVKTALYKANIIVGPAAGIAGVRTDLYKSYKWLVTTADNSSLLKFAEEKNPYIRTYAFMALCRRKDSLVKSLLKKSIHDTTYLNMLDGCLGSSCALNAIWLSKSQDLLSKADYNSFLKECQDETNQGILLCVWFHQKIESENNFLHVL